jgi:processive 1,2-diacylglycerol beta-glucosyltransferase
LIQAAEPRITEGRPRVVLCAADVGCGHSRAATAILLAMRQLRPDLRPRIVEALSCAPGWFNHIYRDAYLAAVKHIPKFNGWLYNHLDVFGTPAYRGIVPVIEKFALRTFCATDDIRQADVIICTHFLCARVLSRLRRRGQLSAKLAVVVTDQHPHAVWRVSDADLYFVASEAAAHEMHRNGVHSNKVVVTGIPIDARFDMPMPKSEARARQKLADTPTLLLTGGGLGLGGLEEALDGAMSVEGEHQSIVVCGHNESLRTRLVERFGTSDRCRIIGVTSKMHELMAAADLLVGKPGGMTSTEAIARALPMVLLRPIPGQEHRNADILVEAGAAVRYDEPLVAGQAAATLLHDGAALERMRGCVQQLRQSGSAQAVAESALKLAAPVREVDAHFLARDFREVDDAAFPGRVPV